MKLRGKAKAAFLRRIARGRAKARRTSGAAKGRRSRKRRAGGFSGAIFRSKKRPGVMRIRLRRNPLQALIVNPADLSDPFAGSYSRRAAKRRKLTRKERSAADPFYGSYSRKRKGSNMAKKRRRKSAKRARGRRVRRSIRVPKAVARRYYKPRRKRAIYLNPSRKRRRFRRVRRRNPGFGGLIRMAFVPYATGIATSAVSAMLDTGLSKWPVVRQLVKVGGVIGIAAFLGRKYPTASAAAIGALGASQGYPLITKLAGGMVARTPAEAVKGLGEMAETDSSMGALLQGGLGALLEGLPDVPGNVSNYETALVNMSDYDGDDD